MPRIINAKERSVYPRMFPIAALEDIQRISKAGSWYRERIAVAHACWELEGAALSLYVGAPEGTGMEESPDPELLADQLYQVREAVHKGVAAMKALTTRPQLSGDVAVEANLTTTARTIEALLSGALTTLAWLRKSALEAARTPCV